MVGKIEYNLLCKKESRKSRLVDSRQLGWRFRWDKRGSSDGSESDYQGHRKWSGFDNVIGGSR